MSQTELFVLAGGFGTRLREAVPHVPKPLAPVAGQPFLRYLLESWVSQGICRITFLLHYQADQIECFLGEQANKSYLRGCEIRTITEPKPLGTGGTIIHAIKFFRTSGSILVVNADTWLGGSINQVVQTSTPAMAAVKVENTQRYGALKIQDHRVVGFHEKQECSGPGWINAGLYHLDTSLFEDRNDEPFSLESDLFPELVKTGLLRAVCLPTDFIDIGIPDDYYRFCKWVESERGQEL